jgi:hypothetical protein
MRQRASASFAVQTAHAFLRLSLQTMEEYPMFSYRSMHRASAATAGFLFAIAATFAAEAAVMPGPASQYAVSGIQLAYGACGPGRQPGLNGVCHPDSWFPYRRFCPPGMHLGPYGRRCWPN